MSTRKERRAARRKAAATLIPPEGVPLTFDVAGIGVRMGAQLLDIILTLLAALALVVLLFATGLLNPETVFAIAMLLFFVIRIPYYVVSELAWNGQTLGKRFMKIKVVANDGGPLRTHALVVRNLMKEAEVLLPATLVLTVSSATPLSSAIALAWIFGSLAVPLFNPRRRRLGDLIAGTYVIHLPDPILLSDMAQTTAAPATERKAFRFLSQHLDHYGAYELQTLEDLLRAEDKTASQHAHARRSATRAVVVEKIRKKIGYADAVDKADHHAFLSAFYNAQRAHLEQKQLFGERRADKHHAGTDADG